MHEKLKKLYARAVGLKQVMTALLIDMRQEMAKCRNESELADHAYFGREMRDLLEEMEKNANKYYDEASRFACLVWMQGNLLKQAQHAKFVPESIKTEYCRAEPSVKEAVNLPHRDSPEYKAFMKHFGVDEKLTELGVVGPHWPRLVDYLDMLATEGKPLPPGLESMSKYNTYKLRITGKKGVCDELPGPDRPAEDEIPF